MSKHLEPPTDGADGAWFRPLETIRACGNDLQPARRHAYVIGQPRLPGSFVVDSNGSGYLTGNLSEISSQRLV